MLYRRDIERMRQPAGVLSSEEIARLRHEAEAELEGQRAVAQARKEKMLKVWYAFNMWTPVWLCLQSPHDLNRGSVAIVLTVALLQCLHGYAQASCEPDVRLCCMHSLPEL